MVSSSPGHISVSRGCHGGSTCSVEIGERYRSEPCQPGCGLSKPDLHGAGSVCETSCECPQARCLSPGRPTRLYAGRRLGGPLTGVQCPRGKPCQPQAAHAHRPCPRPAPSLLAWRALAPRPALAILQSPCRGHTFQGSLLPRQGPWAPRPGTWLAGCGTQTGSPWTCPGSERAPSLREAACA